MGSATKNEFDTLNLRELSKFFFAQIHEQVTFM